MVFLDLVQLDFVIERHVLNADVCGVANVALHFSGIRERNFLRVHVIQSQNFVDFRFGGAIETASEGGHDFQHRQVVVAFHGCKKQTLNKQLKKKWNSLQ